MRESQSLGGRRTEARKQSHSGLKVVSSME